MSITFDVPGGDVSPELDVEEFAALYAQYRDPLRRFCRKRVNDPDAVEDIVQDVFEKAYASRHRFDPRRDFWPWLASIAARACIDAHRRAASAQARHDRYARDTHREPYDVTATTALRTVDHCQVGRHLAALPASQRIALGLFALDELTYEQIGHYLGQSTTAVKALISRARTTLRQTVSRWAGVAVGATRLVRRRGRQWAARVQAAMAAPLDALGLSAAGVGSSVSAVAIAVAVAVAAGVPAPVAPPVASAAPGGVGPEAAAPVPSPAEASPAPVSAAPVPTEGEAPAHRRPLTGGVERAGGELVDAVAPDHAATADPEWMRPTSYAVSPDYEDDPTVFAVGDVFARTGEIGAPLLVSHDDGASWQRLPAVGMSPLTRRLLLPPAYPRDDRLFAVSDVGLQASYDGGAGFETVAALPDTTDAAMSPGFNAGDPTVLLVAGDSLWQYDDSSGSVVPVAVEGPPAGHTVMSVGWAAGPGEEPTVVLGTRPAVDWSSYGVKYVSRCTRGRALATAVPTLTCTSVQLPTAMASGLPLRVPARLGAGSLFVPLEQQPMVSTDGGRSFRVARAGIFSSEEQYYYRIYDLAPIASPSGRSAMVAQSTFTKSGAFAFGPQLARTDDAGGTWTPITVSLPNFAWAVSVVVTPTGRIIAASGQGGVGCSADGGRTWARTCAAG